MIFCALVFAQISCSQNQNVSKSNIKNDANVKQSNLNSVVIKSIKKKNDIDYFANFEPKHKEVLKEWLKEKPFLRPAIEKVDSILDKSSLEDIHKHSETQFYSIGDFNKDRREDFAVLLVDTKNNNDGKFAIAIFNGDSKKVTKPNYFMDNLHKISNVYIKHSKTYDGQFDSDSFILINDYKRNSCGGFIPKENIYESVACI